MKNLEEWCIENNEQILLELYQNGGNKYKSDEIGFSSPRVVKFKCKKCGLSWKQTLNKMSKRPNKECPYCLHHKVSYLYNFQKEYPEIAKEWNYERNINKPSEYLPKSQKKVWWKCKKGHVWQRSIKDSVYLLERRVNIPETLCPICNNERVSGRYNLVTEFPDVAREWNYIKNGSLIPLEVSPKSSKKVWWICKYNPTHIWTDKVGNRTVLNRGCPTCSKKFTISFPARAIYFYLKKFFDDCEMEYKVLDKYITDICIPYYKIIIEYDGWYYHSNNMAQKRENKKDKILKENGFDVIRIKERKENIDKIEYNDKIIEYHLLERKENLDELIKKVISIIKEKTGMLIEENVDVKRDYQKIEDLYYHVRKSNSLAVKYPELAKEWSDKNDMTPDNISIGSGQNIRWICSKCKEEYFATIHNRIKNNSNCPYCSNKKVKSNKENSLFNLFPEIAKEWNYEKNGNLKPTEITKGSDKMVWWKCEKGHEWEARVYTRTGGKYNSKCPYCSHRRLTYENSIEARTPELKEIWNYEKNNGKTPKDFSYSSNKEVWWKCKRGHEWKTSANRIRRIKSKEKCPYCRNIIG